MINEISPIDLAPLHGTILSIIIGIISGYVINLFIRIEDLENSIYRKSNQINNIQPLGTFGPSGGGEFNSSDDQTRSDLLYKLRNLSSSLYSDDDLPKTPSERGEKLLIILSALLHNYPFSQRSQDNSSTVRGDIEYGNPATIKFTKIKNNRGT